MDWIKLITFLAVVVLVACEADTSSVADDKALGNQIIFALEKFKTERGSYPDLLADLVPEYVPQIIQPRYGERRWEYVHRCKEDSFALYMWGRAPSDDGYAYASQEKNWITIENRF